MQHIESVYALL